MLLHKDQAALLAIDIQEKLLPAIMDSESMHKRVQWLVGVARDFGLPITFSEQYPRGLGRTMEALLALAPNALVVEKLHFSCIAAHCLPENLLMKKQLVLCGMETHICVLQTALDLIAAGKQVFVVADACGSRTNLDHQLGIERMRQAGAIIVSKEMVLFELMEQAGTEHFKTMSKRYLQGDQP